MTPASTDAAIRGLSSGRAVRWRLIQQCAVELYDRHGYAVVSIDDIAGAAGVSRRTFFNYFSSKAAVLFDPDPDEISALTALLDGADRQQDPWETLTGALRAYIDHQHHVVSTRRRVLRAQPKLDEYHLFANTHFEDTLSDWLIRSGVADFPAQVMAGVALAVVRESFKRWDPEQPGSDLDALMDEGFSVIAPVRGRRPGRPRHATLQA